MIFCEGWKTSVLSLLRKRFRRVGSWALKLYSGHVDCSLDVYSVPHSAFKWTFLFHLVFIGQKNYYGISFDYSDRPLDVSLSFVKASFSVFDLRTVRVLLKKLPFSVLNIHFFLFPLDTYRPTFFSITVNNWFNWQEYYLVRKGAKVINR